MAEFPSQALIDIERGRQYLSVLNQEYLNDLKQGCVDCMPDAFDCLRYTIRALEYKLELDQYDSVSIALIEIMLKIIGGYVTEIPPTVTTTGDQSIEIGSGDVIFVATGIPGNSPIVSYLWTQISGPTATLSGQTTNTLTVTNYSIGEAVFRVTVTDQNNRTATATDTLTVTGALVEIRWGFFDVEPDLSTVVFPNSMSVAAGSSEFAIPFGQTATNKFIAWDQPSDETDKNAWFNTVLNYGTVPDAVFKAKVVANGRSRYGTRDIFSFDSSNYNLTVSLGEPTQEGEALFGPNGILNDSAILNDEQIYDLSI